MTRSPRTVGGSNSDEWYTSPDTLNRCKALAGVTAYDLDVAACEEAHCASVWFGQNSGAAQNGLAQAWFGNVWCNPPFSQCAQWIAKAWAEQHNAKSISMLLPANRTESKWWQGMIEPARLKGDIEVYFLPGRAAFAHPGSGGVVKKGSTFGLVLIVWRNT